MFNRLVPSQWCKDLLAKSQYFRLTPFDCATEDGRRSERYRRAALTTILSLFSRGASLAVVFVSLRIALPYLGGARFGVWMTISSMTAVLMVFDFGIGNGMVSRVANLSTGTDPQQLRKLIMLGLVTLGAIGILIGGILALIAAWAPIAWLYKGASPDLIVEARRALVIFGVLFGLSVPLQATHRIYAGLQEGYISQAVAGLMSLISVATLSIIPRFHASVSVFLLFTYGIQQLSGAILLVRLHHRFQFTLPLRDIFRVEELRHLMRGSGLFFVLQIAGVIGWNMDASLLSSLIGPASVVVYSVVQRLFMLVTVPLSMLNGPLWASYADAHARGEVDFVRRTFFRSMISTACLATLGVITIWIFLGPLASLMVKDAVQIPMAFVLIFGAWTVVSATGDALAMYMNGVNILLPQVLACTIFVVVTLSLKITLVSTYGLNGLAAISLLSYLATFGVLYTTLFRATMFRPLRAP